MITSILDGKSAFKWQKVICSMALGAVRSIKNFFLPFFRLQKQPVSLTGHKPINWQLIPKIHKWEWEFIFEYLKGDGRQV
jgi:hypothetical protein